MSIERLETIRDNQYRSSCGKFEYCKETIDDELNRKYTEQDERQLNEQLEQLEQMENESMETTKKRTLPTTCDSQENAYIEEIDVSHLSPRNARRKYTQRAHWLEYNKRHGYRYCTASYDNNRKTWCKPNKGTYSIFKFLCFDLDGEIRTNGFSTYETNTENMLGLIDQYELDAEQIKFITNYAQGMEQAKERYEKAKESAKEEMIKTRKDFTDYAFNTLYELNEINKCTSDMKLLKLFASGHAIKKKCRKSDYFNEAVGFIVLPPDSTDAEVKKELANKMLELTKPHAENLLKNKFREVKTATYSAKDVEYQAPYNKEELGFYGMKEVLFDKPIAQRWLVE
jgi:hypothetical protein